ncbi:NAD(P)-binding protein, partial [Aureobasidium melanogenum]
MSSPISKVAIVGATGNMGKHTIAELQRSNKHSITALTRKGSNISLSSSINVIEVDYDSIENLTSALQNQDLLMITLAVDAPPHIHPNLVSAAAAAGVKYVIPNAYGFDFTNPAINADIPFGHIAQQHFSSIESKGMVHFSLVCGFWYEWSLGIPWCYGIDLVHRKAIFYDDGNTKMNTSTWEQCGRAIAALLSLSEQELEKYKNRSFIQPRGRHKTSRARGRSRARTGSRARSARRNGSVGRGSNASSTGMTAATRAIGLDVGDIFMEDDVQKKELRDMLKERPLIAYQVKSLAWMLQRLYLGLLQTNVAYDMGLGNTAVGIALHWTSSLFIDEHNRPQDERQYTNSHYLNMADLIKTDPDFNDTIDKIDY